MLIQVSANIPSGITPRPLNLASFLISKFPSHHPLHFPFQGEGTLAPTSTSSSGAAHLPGSWSPRSRQPAPS